MKFQIKDKENKITILNIDDKNKFLKQKRSEGFELVGKGIYYNRKTKELIYSSTHFNI